eukprot:6462598-Heterocapsa_arctica.AAC.1
MKFTKIFWFKLSENEDRIRPKLSPSEAQMAMNWSMANAKALEGEQGRPAPEIKEEEKFEKSEENMERIVLQSE